MSSRTAAISGRSMNPILGLIHILVGRVNDILPKSQIALLPTSLSFPRCAPENGLLIRARQPHGCGWTDINEPHTTELFSSLPEAREKLE